MVLMRSLRVSAPWFRMNSTSVVKSKRASAKTYRDLVVWQVSMQLVADTYRLAARLPAIERYGLATQLRRAALSMPLNIAEGFGRRSAKGFARFVRIAEGSLRELQTLLEIMNLLEYVAAPDVAKVANTANRVGFLLHRLRNSLRLTP
jgi:four helix bundle protein